MMAVLGTGSTRKACLERDESLVVQECRWAVPEYQSVAKSGLRQSQLTIEEHTGRDFTRKGTPSAYK